MPYERALTELAHGQFLRRRRQRRAAVEVLANARDRFAAVGARPALERCERELKASGLAPKRPAAKGAGRLTPQELTVTRLVIDGMTNREIAAELMLSTKTVEVHLTRLYAKLEVPSRTELRARARRGELAAGRGPIARPRARRAAARHRPTRSRGAKTIALDARKRFAEVAVHEDRRGRPLGRGEASQPEAFAAALAADDHVRRSGLLSKLLGRHVGTESTAGTEGGAARLGRRISKAAPPPGAFAALTEPRCASTIVPDAFVSAGTR